MLLNDSITPQFFETVKISHFIEENMHHDVYVIQQHPFLMFNAFHVPWFFSQFLCCFFFNAFCNRFYLSVGCCIADHKKIAHGIANVAKINSGDVFTFFIFYGINDYFNFRRTSWLLPW